MSKNRVTFTLSPREAELMAHAVQLRLDDLKHRSLNGDPKAAYLAEEYVGLNEQTQRINAAIRREMATAA